MFSGSIPALITPFQKGEETIDFAQMQNLIAMHIREKTDGIVVGGTTGEGPSYSEEEYRKVIEVSVTSSKGLIDIIVNSGTNVTKNSVERTQTAKKCGAQAALVIVPYYNMPNFAGITKHFQEVAKVGLPIIVYHHPGRTGISLTAEQIVSLHKIDNIVGIKEASNDPTLTCRICNLMPDAVVFAGNDELALEVLACGGRGSISVIANILPRLWHELMTDPSRTELFKQALPLISAVGLDVNPQGIKCAMSALGLCENQLRLPLVPASAEIQEKVVANLFSLNLT